MKPGTIIADRYEIRGVLGRGGMGEVYLAYDQRLDTEVALKRVPLELSIEPHIRQALISEARILARLTDSRIVRLFDLADTADGLFLVLEYVCGPSLDKVLAARGTLTVEELRHVMDHVAEGLTRAHGMGVVHRDLKPSNLLVALAGDERRRYLRDGTLPDSLVNAEIKVTDFGLAKVVRQSQAQASHSFSGTPAYMAPEQYRGEMPSVETDVYALGFVAYACLTGGVPIGNAEPMYFHLYLTPPPIVSVPPPINAAIQRAIRKDRAERFGSAMEFARALKEPAPPPKPRLETIAEPTPRKEERKDDQRRWLWWIVGIAGAGVVAVVLVSLLAGYALWRSMRGTASPTSVTQAQVIPETRAEMPPLAPLNPAPRVDTLPPVIENARLKPAPVPKGIERPVAGEHLWVTGMQVFGFGGDGTAYVTSDTSNIGAVRNGQLLWQYRLGSDAARFHISEDGLIWVFSGMGTERLFCFNAAGQGGEIMDPALMARFPVSLRYSTPKSAECVAPSPTERDPSVKSGRWRVALDQRCANDPVVTRDGKVVVQTQARTLYLIGGDGRVQWTYPGTCELNDVVVLSDDTVVGRCYQPRKLVGVRGGSEAFSIDADTRAFAADADGGFYRLASGATYDRQLLVRTDSHGRDLWKLELRSALRPDGSLAPDGSVYLFNRSPAGYDLRIIRDSR